MNKKELSDVKISLLDNKARQLEGKKSAALHIHDEAQILAGSSGILEVTVAAKRINLRVGDVMIIKSRVPHSVKPILPFTATVVIQARPDELFPARFDKTNCYLALALQKNEKDFIFLRREDSATAEIFEIITRMNEENSKKQKSYALFTNGYMKILAGLLQRNNVLSAPQPPLNTDALAKLSAVFEHVEKNISREISLEEAASVLGMNREYFCRLFKKSTGLTFIDYTNFVRIHLAEELLISTQKSISEISDGLGFSSVSYFTRVFKNITDITPANYRNIKHFKTELL